MKNLTAVLLYLVTAASAVSFSKVVHEEWKAFKLEYKKHYETEAKERYHMKIYIKNKHAIAKHNQLFERGLVSYAQKLNEFSDLPHHTFVSTMNGYVSNNTKASDVQEESGVTFMPPANWYPPPEVDWRKQGAVTEIKNQKGCRSCWAFSATGALEGLNFRYTGKLVSLSEQNLIDCTLDRQYNNHGCKGGEMKVAFQYIKDNKGIDTEKSYPYEAMAFNCRYNPLNRGAKDVGYVNIPKYNEVKLMEAVASVGPVSAAVDGMHESFRHYSHGVYKGCRSGRKINHGVLVVGYGTEANGEEYWLVKNSWGLSWGEQGYGKIARNWGNMCGIASDASYPLM